MKKNLILLYGVFLFTLHTFDSIAACRDNPNPIIRPKINGPLDEVKVTDLIWEDYSKVPKDAIKFIKKIYPYPESTSYSFFDFNDDGINEIIFKNSDYSGSGGQGFSIFEKQKNKWVEILAVSGGFIINSVKTPEDFNHKYYRVTLWHRYGARDTIQYFFAYKNNKYQLVSDQPVPLTILYSKDFQKMILAINSMCWDFWN